MSDLYLAKITSRTGRVGFVPADEDAHAAVRRLGDGECVVVKLKQVRSLPTFRRWWAICGAIGENQEPARDRSSICNEIKILAGYYDVLPIEGAEGYQVRTPKSISFERLTEDDWQLLWPKLEAAARARFGNEFFDQGAAW